MDICGFQLMEKSKKYQPNITVNFKDGECKIIIETKEKNIFNIKANYFKLIKDKLIFNIQINEDKKGKDYELNKNVQEKIVKKYDTNLIRLSYNIINQSPIFKLDISNLCKYTNVNQHNLTEITIIDKTEQSINGTTICSSRITSTNNDIGLAFYYKCQNTFNGIIINETNGETIESTKQFIYNSTTYYYVDYNDINLNFSSDLDCEIFFLCNYIRFKNRKKNNFHFLSIFFFQLTVVKKSIYCKECSTRLIIKTI